jgi:glucose/arabinose dehydrogenase
MLKPGSRRDLPLLAAFALVIAVDPGSASAQGAAVLVASDLAAPIYVAAPPGDTRLFIVERGGTIKVLANGSVSGTNFLDISDRVNEPVQSEAGLLSLAFAPDYAQTGVFYVYYTGDPSQGGSVEKRVSRFVAADPASSATVDANTETILFRQEQTPTNHIGGTIAIRDGYLYLGLGDGGGDGEVAQSDASDFGKMLRFDITQQQVPWSFEHWAKGFRNPFRWSFDHATGALYIGDVGQSSREEIDVEPADSPGGLNYGWDVMEGTNCFDPSSGEPPCFDPSLVPPVFDYANDGNTCAVTGGAVYRGNASPSLRGVYFFSDLCSGRILSLRWNPQTGQAEDVLDRTSEFPPDVGSYEGFGLVAVAAGGDGELYLVKLSGNSIYRLVPEPAPSLLGVTTLATLACVARRRRARGWRATVASAIAANHGEAASGASSTAPAVQTPGWRGQPR